MKKLKHKTLLIVTHSLDHLKYSDYIFVINDGRIIKEGDYEEVQHMITKKEFGLVNAVRIPRCNLRLARKKTRILKRKLRIVLTRTRLTRRRLPTTT